ncbi:putative ABM domain-containing protein [Seiridium cardinale]
MAPFIQFATLPIANGSFDKAIGIYGPFSDMIKQDVPGCLEFALYKSQDSATQEVDIIISERYVDSKTHDAFTSSAVYQEMLNRTAEENVLRGAPVLTVVNQVGGFTNRGNGTASS